MTTVLVYGPILRLLIIGEKTFDKLINLKLFQTAAAADQSARGFWPEQRPQEHLASPVVSVLLICQLISSLMD